MQIRYETGFKIIDPNKRYVRYIAPPPPTRTERVKAALAEEWEIQKEAIGIGLRVALALFTILFPALLLLSLLASAFR